MSDSATISVRSLRRADLPKLSLTTKAAATLLAIVAAVALPQLFHVIGAVSGQGTALGVAFLPMHLPIIFVGLVAGPAVGAIADDGRAVCVRTRCRPAAFGQAAGPGQGGCRAGGRSSGADRGHGDCRVRLRFV